MADSTSQLDYPATDLSNLTPTELISRINDLESRLKSTTAQLAALTNTTTLSTASPKPKQFSKPKKVPKPFDFSRYQTRHVALKFAYLGLRYNGYEHTNGGLPPLKPTIEEMLWKALRKARLIDPAVDEGCDASFEVVFDERERRRIYWGEGLGADGNGAGEKLKLQIDWVGKGLGYSKCGRTDKGVSAFGQVVGIRLRSNRPKIEKRRVEEDEGEEVGGAEENEDGFDDVKDELPYVGILNSVLPSDIKILAWCPHPGPSFDARFSCKERRYKYFFTNPAFCPTPGNVGLSYADGRQASVRDGWLDIEAMKKAAKKLEGLHDYRNFCKIDASKQMSSCERRITFADVQEMSGGVGLDTLTTNPDLNANGQDTSMTNGAFDASPTQGPKVYAFCVHGTAFLWHQVRCMVAIIFLVGQGLEKPEVVDELLDIQQNPARPSYEMADDAPLVLWDCVFPGDQPEDQDGLKWIYAGDEASISGLANKSDNQFDGKFGTGGLVTDLWAEWREAKIRETLTAGLLSLALTQGDGTSLQRGGYRYRHGPELRLRSQRIFDGNNSGRTVGEYQPVMQKPKLATLELQNAKYLEGKQARRDLKKLQTPSGG